MALSSRENPLKSLGLPLLFLVIIASLFLVWKLLDLPQEDKLMQIARNYFERYGLWTVLVSSILEGALLIGWYFPGGLVIFLGVIFAGNDIMEAAQVVAMVTLGFFIAYTLNFILGKYGWYRLLLALGLKKPLERAQHRLKKHGLNAIFLSYWQPGLAALSSTAAGILQFPVRSFLIHSTVAILFWNIFWGTLVYVMGKAALSLIGFKFVLIMLGIWMAIKLLFPEKHID